MGFLFGYKCGVPFRYRRWLTRRRFRDSRRIVPPLINRPFLGRFVCDLTQRCRWYRLIAGKHLSDDGGMRYQFFESFVSLHLFHLTLGDKFYDYLFARLMVNYFFLLTSTLGRIHVWMANNKSLFCFSYFNFFYMIFYIIRSFFMFINIEFLWVVYISIQAEHLEPSKY